jgi:thymidylate kinase
VVRARVGAKHIGCETLEIVGVAGAGKSTLARTINERFPAVEIADTLHTKALAHLPYVARGIPRAVPLLAKSAALRPVFDWEETKFIVYVAEWRQYLARRGAHTSGLVVLDQGPVFALARLLWSGKRVTASRRFRAWMDEMIRAWSLVLDGIVHLVAPDEVLLERINERGQSHEAKGRPTGESLDILLSHEAAYAELLTRFAQLGRPPIYSFDTSALSPAEIAEDLAALRAARASMRPEKVRR